MLEEISYRMGYITEQQLIKSCKIDVVKQIMAVFVRYFNELMSPLGTWLVCYE